MKQAIVISLTILLFGVSVFFRKLAVDRIHPYQLQIVAGAIYAIEIPIWLFLLHKNNISGYNSMGVVYGVLCIATYVLAAVLFGTLLKSANSAGQSTILVSINPIVTLCLSMIFLGEVLTLKKVIACALALCGLILFNL